MIYLDNAATTYPKPSCVYNEIILAMKKYGANPGRSGHNMSVKSESEVEKCRQLIKDLFGAKSPEDIAFTMNCTYAINMVLKGLLKPGDHVVTSCLEHNAMMRPLKKLESLGITHTAVEIFPENNDKTLDSFRKGINSKTALIACTYASNVFGVKLPINRISALAKIYKIPILVDAAQAAGIVPIDIQKDGIDYLCAAGHKGLYGPMGTGLIITSKADKLDTIIEGGTGTSSMLLCQPGQMPQKLESGTPNMIGISGLKAGVDFVKRQGIKNIFEHEMKLIKYAYEGLKNIKNVELYLPKPSNEYFVPVLSFNLKGHISDETGKILNKNGIAVRTGLHCSPASHKFFGTIEKGTVRISPSIYNKKSDIDKLLKVVSFVRN